jgi:hypothetical protein
MIVDFLSSKACMTSNFARSAFCYAIYFCSIDFLNSTPKSKLTIETSSNIILKSFNLFLIPYLILMSSKKREKKRKKIVKIKRTKIK